MIDETTIDDPEELDLVMPMYNLLEYSSNYPGMKDCFWFDSKGEAANYDANIVNSVTSYNNNKPKLSRKTEVDGAYGVLRNTKIAVSLKYLNNIRISLEMLLIN